MRHNVTPLEDIKKYWNLTYDARREILKKSTTSEYFQNFRCLTQCDGYLFLLEDFNKLYPEKEINILYEKWPQIKKYLTTLYIEKGVEQNFDDGK